MPYQLSLYQVTLDVYGRSGRVERVAVQVDAPSQQEAAESARQWAKLKQPRAVRVVVRRVTRCQE